MIAVVITGLSKGGFAGLSVLSLPLLSLVVPPIQGAAIMLPILMMQDCISVWAYRKSFDRRILTILIAGSLIGIALGVVFATRVSNAAIEAMVGAIAAGFVLRTMLRGRSGANETRSTPDVVGIFWGACAGFTSFIANAGAPPFQVYVLPRRLQPETYAGTATMFFAIINVIKLFVFIGIGQVSHSNLSISIALFPVAVAAALLGVWLVRAVKSDRFYLVIYIITFVIGVYLVWHGTWTITQGMSI
jgi:uncharacterized membrane protein YfcA